jgi:ATP/ADP translocase
MEIDLFDEVLPYAFFTLMIILSIWVYNLMQKFKKYMEFKNENKKRKN